MSLSRKHWDEKSTRKPGRCHQCRVAKFRLIEPYFTGLPRFRCDHCNIEWSAGNSGGEYMRELVQLGTITEAEAAYAADGYRRTMGFE